MVLIVAFWTSSDNSNVRWKILKTFLYGYYQGFCLNPDDQIKHRINQLKKNIYIKKK